MRIRKMVAGMMMACLLFQMPQMQALTYGAVESDGGTADIQLQGKVLKNNMSVTVLVYSEKTKDLIEGANGKPVLIAYWYKSDLKRIKDKFDVRELKTSEDFKEWNQGKISVAIIHPASAGHGLNLQAGGSTLIWFSLTWSLELYEQTNARLYRQGQKETVVIHHILAKGTIDEDVMKALESKNKTQAALIEAVKANLES